jgi:hypothetical protein
VAISIPTDRWIFYAKDTDPRSQPQYIVPAKNLAKDGPPGLTEADLLNNKVDPRKPTEYYQVYFPTKVKESCDHFKLTFRVRVNKLNNESCPFFICEIYSQQYFMFFQSTLKGCTSEAKAQFGENYVSGKTHDLSALGMNLDTWQNLTVEVKNKKVSIRINDTDAYQTSYTQSCGLITGIGFISSGLAQVESIDLKTTDGRPIIQY